MKIEHIEYKGKKITIFNWNQCKNHDELVQLVEDVGAEFKRSPDKLLTIDDFTDTFVSSEFMVNVKKVGKELYATKREKGAILGITGIKKALLDAYKQFSKDNLIPFKTKQEALDYLVNE